MSSARDVAAWMLEEVMRSGYAEQESIGYEIVRRFGAGFVYDNENGNQAIGKDVLKEFRKLSADTIVWVRSGKAWRKREPSDDNSRMQD